MIKDESQRLLAKYFDTNNSEDFLAYFLYRYSLLIVRVRDEKFPESEYHVRSYFWDKNILLWSRYGKDGFTSIMIYDLGALSVIYPIEKCNTIFLKPEMDKIISSSVIIEKMDNRPYCAEFLPVQGKVINMSTGQIRQRTEEDNFVSKLNLSLEPNPEDIKFVQNYLDSCLEDSRHFLRSICLFLAGKTSICLRCDKNSERITLVHALKAARLTEYISEEISFCPDYTFSGCTRSYWRLKQYIKNEFPILYTRSVDEKDDISLDPLVEIYVSHASATSSDLEEQLYTKEKLSALFYLIYQNVPEPGHLQVTKSARKVSRD